MVESRSKNMFVRGAYLYNGLADELSEQDFIKRCGIKNLKKFAQYPYVSMVLDNPKKPFLIGHLHGRTIAVTMAGHKKWQTMEWVK